jgi:serine phosphatase RsbU (regulator of sigma subunit)
VELLKEHRGASASQLQKRILASVSEFTCGHWQDDATLLVLAVGEK